MSARRGLDLAGLGVALATTPHFGADSISFWIGEQCR